jgi:hypothetical protein
MSRSPVFVTLFVALAGTATVREAAADELNFATITPERPNIVGARTGLDSALVFELDYRRIVEVLGRTSAIGVELAAPGAELDASDYRVSAGAAIPLVGGDHWKLIAHLSPTLRSTENGLNRMLAVGADTRLTGGFYARRWFAAGELGVDWVAASHIRHSDEYRDVVYADAEDGWYRNPGGTLYVGAHAGLSFSRFDVVLRAGRQQHVTMDAQTMPFFATLGVNVTLPR